MAAWLLESTVSGLSAGSGANMAIQIQGYSGLVQEVDGAKEVAETAREDADYWKSRIDALNDKIIELRKQAKTIWTSARDAKPPHDTEVLLRTVEFATWQEVETNLGLWAPDGVIDSLTEWRYIEDSDRHLQDELRIQSDIDAADAANYKSGIGY